MSNITCKHRRFQVKKQNGIPIVGDAIAYKTV